MATHVNWHDTRNTSTPKWDSRCSGPTTKFQWDDWCFAKEGSIVSAPQPSFNSVSHPCHRVSLSNGHPEPGSDPLCPFTILSSSNVSLNDDKAFFHCRLTTVSIHRNALSEEWKIWSRNVKWRRRRREWNEENEKDPSEWGFMRARITKGPLKCPQSSLSHKTIYKWDDTNLLFCYITGDELFLMKTKMMIELQRGRCYTFFNRQKQQQPEIKKTARKTDAISFGFWEIPRNQSTLFWAGLLVLVLIPVLVTRR